MADSQQQEYFPVGATVQCVTCLGEKVEGEVVAFDHASKLLALSMCESSYSPVRKKTLNSNV